MDHEQAFVSVFVVPEKRDRFKAFLLKPKKRNEITGRFSHHFDFVPSLVEKIPRGSASIIAPLLRAKGAGEVVHVIGGNSEIDGTQLPLEKAIVSAMNSPSGVVLSCVPGRLALLLQEFPPGDMYILHCK